MPSTPRYHEVYTRRDGSSYFYMSDDTPPYVEDWTDNLYLHIFWSYSHTAKKVFRAYFPKR